MCLEDLCNVVFGAVGIILTLIWWRHIKGQTDLELYLSEQIVKLGEDTGVEVNHLGLFFVKELGDMWGDIYTASLRRFKFKYSKKAIFIYKQYNFIYDNICFRLEINGKIVYSYNTIHGDEVDLLGNNDKVTIIKLINVLKTAYI